MSQHIVTGLTGPAYGTPPQRSAEWLDLIDASNNWQQTYDALMYEEGRAYSDADHTRVAQLAKAEQLAYDEWQHALVKFERANNTRRLFA